MAVRAPMLVGRGVVRWRGRTLFPGPFAAVITRAKDASRIREETVLFFLVPSIVMYRFAASSGVVHVAGCQPSAGPSLVAMSVRIWT
jgi:hypothetical protein